MENIIKWYKLKYTHTYIHKVKYTFYTKRSEHTQSVLSACVGLNNFSLALNAFTESTFDDPKSLLFR